MTTDPPVRGREPRWRVDEHVAWTESEGRVVVLPLTAPDSPPMALAGSAGVIWSLLVEHGPVGEDDLVTMISEEFELDAQQVQTDVVSLLTELRSRRAASCD
ncbi:PqqD family protein [Microbacterium oxydans]|uniref:PqqD family protein n=1 Tax=Microbacterium oxydans TaxID=82380 RepID=UPI0022B171FE|nr:PqqD family protein [Microbacterium oxydans]MCZ4299801.1 PqqD family protein [Microbacterium oxydans]